VAAKICLNVALIRSELGDHIESVFMHELSLKYKLEKIPKLSDEIRDQYILLGFAQQRAELFEEACFSLDQAYKIQLATNGEQDYKTVQLLSQLADAHLRELKNEPNLEEAARYFEQAATVLTKLIKDSEKKKGKVEKMDQKLDKIYLKLLDIYM
jgi:hypothetical protein